MYDSEPKLSLNLRQSVLQSCNSMLNQWNFEAKSTNTRTPTKNQKTKKKFYIHTQPQQLVPLPKHQPPPPNKPSSCLPKTSTRMSCSRRSNSMKTRRWTICNRTAAPRKSSRLTTLLSLSVRWRRHRSRYGAHYRPRSGRIPAWPPSGRSTNGYMVSTLWLCCCFFRPSHPLFSQQT